MGFPSGMAVQGVLVQRMLVKLRELDDANRRLTGLLAFSSAVIGMIFDHLNDAAAIRGESLQKYKVSLEENREEHFFGVEGIAWIGDAAISHYDRLRFFRNRLAHFSHENGGFSIVEMFEGKRGVCLSGVDGNNRPLSVKFNRPLLVAAIEGLARGYLTALEDDGDFRLADATINDALDDLECKI